MKADLDERLRASYRDYQGQVTVPPAPDLPVSRRVTLSRRTPEEKSGWRGALLAACLVACMVPLSLSTHKEPPVLGRMLYETSQDQRAIQAGSDMTLRFIDGLQEQFKRSES